MTRSTNGCDKFILGISVPPSQVISLSRIALILMHNFCLGISESLPWDFWVLSYTYTQTSIMDEDVK